MTIDVPTQLNHRDVVLVFRLWVVVLRLLEDKKGDIGL